MSAATPGGSEVPAVIRRVTQEKILRYAEASGDFNPIHVDEEYARRSPFGGTIAHGMLVLAYISSMMTDAFGQRWLAGGRLKVRFKAPARPGDVLTASARPQGGAAVEDSIRQFAVECSNEKGEALVTGTAAVSGDEEGATV